MIVDEFEGQHDLASVPRCFCWRNSGVWKFCGAILAGRCEAGWAVVDFLAMRRVQAILVIVALLATPLALLARAVDPDMPDCNGMCCLPHGGHHHSPAKNTAPASPEDEMACHHVAGGHIIECSMRSGQPRMDYGLIAPFPPARTSVVGSIDQPKISRLTRSQFPAVNLSAGFLAGPFQPPRS
jgi:hypothetical protein